MACPLCGAEREVLVHETWAGKWQSTCNHGACAECLCTVINQQLGRCKDEGQLRVRCFHEGCLKMIPQTLVLSNSLAAGCLASELDLAFASASDLSHSQNLKIDWFSKVCERCNTQSIALIENECGHAACESCWRAVVEEQLPDCYNHWKQRAACFGCHQPVCPTLWSHLSESSRAVNAFDRCIRTEIARMLRTVPVDQLIRTRAECDAGPVCPICREHRLALISNGTCDHIACEDCWQIWVDTQIERCRFERKVAMCCLGEACKAEASAKLWAHVCTRSAEADLLERHIQRRIKLKTNVLFPEAVQVDCPCTGCVGIGYLGYDTVMCFICEHQWNADGSAPAADGGIEEFAGVIMKKCPKCEEYIEKYGGCDHMTCRCGHEFYWTTLKPYRAGAT